MPVARYPLVSGIGFALAYADPPRELFRLEWPEPGEFDVRVVDLNPKDTHGGEAVLAAIRFGRVR